MAKPQARYLPALDGLRAVAVAAVVAFHLGRLRGGFLGVDVFFVVSGFLITRLLLAEWEGTGSISLRAFWGRRFRRLVPALLLVLAVVALASRMWLPGWRLGDIRNDALSAMAYVANWRFVSSGQSYFAQGIGPSPLRHTWSLAIEEQFYVVWPLVVLGVATLAARRRTDLRRAVGITAAVGAVLSAAWMALAASNRTGDLTRVYYGTDTRAFAVLAGGWLATWWDPAITRSKQQVGHTGRRLRDQRWAAGGIGGLVGLGILVLTVSEDALGTYRGLFQLAAILSVVTVAGLATGEGGLARALSGPIPQWVGRRSYGIYLWSWPVQVFALAHFSLRGWTLDLVVVAATLGLAAASYRLVESPVLAGRQVRVEATDRPADVVVSRRPWGLTTVLAERRPAVTATMAVVGVVGLLVVVAVGAPPKPSLLSVTDDQVAAVALQKGSRFTTTPDELTSTTRPSAASSTTTTAASKAKLDPVGVPTDPSLQPGPLPPGPFVATDPLLVRTPAPDPTAVFGRPLRVMVAGDSVGWSIAWGASLPTLTRSVQVSNRALVGCGILPADTIRVPVSDKPEPYAQLCKNATEAQRLGLAEHPDVVLLWIGAWEVFDQRVGTTDYKVGTGAYARLLESQLQSLITTYREAGVPTVVPLVPCFGPSPVYPVERLDPKRIAWVSARVRAVAARNRGWVRIIDPTDQLCNADGTTRTRTPEGIEIRPDGAHFESDSAVWFWNTWLAGELAGAFPNPG